MGRASLSVCMIVRNEARALPGCLRSLKEVASQIVVVDTGSMDGTVAIAESLGAEVHHFDWIDDFAAARNESIRFATEPWILWLDADELLPEYSIDHLTRLLVSPQRPTIYQVQIKNLQTDMQSYTLSMSHRLFTRHPKLCFSGRIHEQIHPSLKDAGGVEKPSQITLEHQGYALDEAGMKAKFVRNQPMLLAQVKEQPRSGYAHYTLGQNHALQGNQEDALRSYGQALDIKDFSGSSLATLLNAMAESCWQLGRLDEAEDYARRSLSITSRQSSGNFIMYRIMGSRGNAKRQIESLQAILPLSRTAGTPIKSDLPKDVLIPKKHLLYSLGELFLSDGQPASAENVLRKCLKLDPENLQTLRLLATALASQNHWEELLTVLTDQAGPSPGDLKEQAGVAMIKLRRFEEAIRHYRTWFDEEPAHEGLRERLAGLYAKTGNREAAKRLLQEGAP